jgi:NADH-quinone oxidoreductase subunit J
MKAVLLILKICYPENMNIIFIISLVVALFSALKVITRINAVHALLYMVAFFFAMAVMIYLYGSPFIAVLEVIIYAGAIVTLFVFVVMMLNIRAKESKTRFRIPLLPLLFILVIQAELVFLVFNGPESKNAPVFSDPAATGYALISNYMAAIELAAMLLLAGITGAYHLGHEKKKNLHRYLSNTEENE